LFGKRIDIVGEHAALDAGLRRPHIATEAPTRRSNPKASVNAARSIIELKRLVVSSSSPGTGCAGRR
jgi:hypothetical protein